MRFKVILVQFVTGILLFLYNQSQAQIFPCDGSIYISQNADFPGAPTSIYRMIIDDSGIIVTEIASTNLTLNSTGYNPADNFIYALARPGNRIYRVRSDGVATSIYSEPTITDWLSGAGDVRAVDSVYIVHERQNDNLYLYKLSNPVQKIAQQELIWDSGSGNSGIANLQLDDLVVDPTDPGTAYSYQRNYSADGPALTRGSLLRINIDMNSSDFGKVYVIGQIDINHIRHLGALFYDSPGQLYGYGSRVINPLNQNTLISINTTTAETEIIDTGPGAEGNDGCSCPFYIQLDKTALVEPGCGIASIEFIVTVKNNSLDSLSGFVFVDTLPIGFEIVNVQPSDGGMGGTLTIQASPPVVRIDNGNLPSQGSATFSIVANSSEEGVFFNQALIAGLSARLGESIVSDDPTTFQSFDPTEVEVAFSSEEMLVELEEELCQGDTLFLYGTAYTSSGEYEQILPSETGCDTFLMITIDAVQEPMGFFNATLCEGEQLTVNGIVYSAEGLYEQVLPNMGANGCDSLLIIDISQVEFNEENARIVLCPEEVLEINGEFYNTPGVFEQLFPNGSVDGCDSVLVLNIIEGLEPVTNIREEICEGDILEINGILYGEAGQYTDVLENAARNGCDSILEIQISTLQLPTSFFEFNICTGDTMIFNGESYTGLTEEVISLQSAAANGCDSIIYLSIQVFPESALEYQDSYVIELGDSVIIGFDYEGAILGLHWTPSQGLSCDNCISPVASPVLDMNYTFTFSDEYGCVHSGEISLVVNRSNVMVFIPNVFSPNGDGINDILTVYSPFVSEIQTMTVFDRWGNTVWEGGPIIPDDPGAGWDGTFNGEYVGPGVYVYRIVLTWIDGEESVIAGDITLIR